MRPAAEIERWLIERLATTLGRPVADVDPDETFARFGLASVEVVGLVGALEDWTGEAIEQTVVFQWPTPRELAAALAGTAPTGHPTSRPDPVPVRADDPVVVVGLSCRFPGAASPERFWRNLLDGVDAVTEVPANRWDVERHYDPDPGVAGRSYTRRGAFLDDVAGWDAGFFGLSPQEALRTDPQQRLLAELVWEGIEDAGIPAESLSGSRTGLLVGLMDTGQYTRLQLDGEGDRVLADPNFGLGCASSVAAGRIAHRLNLRGPAFTVDTACSSSLVAVHLAAQSLTRGEADLVLAAGVSLVVHPSFHVQACAMSMLSPEGMCRTFDERADGFAMGEGGGVVVLERLSDAVRHGHRIRAVLRGSAVNQDGRSNGLTAPNQLAQVEVIREAVAAAGLRPEQIGYVEAHGSGTRLGDAVELGALHQVFGERSPDRPLRVGAVKTNIGHTLAAAGMAGLVKAVLALENERLPPNLHCEQPSRAIPADGTIAVLDAATRFPATGSGRFAGVSSFGWAGTNAHVVLEQAPPAPRPVPGPPWQVLTFSAAAPAALTAQAHRLGEHLGGGPDLADIAYSTQTGRTRLEYRRALVCRDIADARSLLSDPHLRPAAPRGSHRPRVGFLLPGVGDQYAGMGRRLHATEPVFAAAFDHCADVLRERCGVDLAPVLAVSPTTPASLAALVGRAAGADPGAGPEAGLDRPEVLHSYVVAVEIALARLLAHAGVRPDVVIGYSLGEYTAACLAGVFSVEDALVLVTERARLVGEQPPGTMLAVAASEEQTLRAVDGLMDVAAVNGPGMTVLAGTPEAAALTHRRLLERGLAGRFLRTTHPFHSSLLEPVRDRLRELVAGVERHPPTVPLAGNLTGELLTDAQVLDPGYWADHLCRPVRFAEGLQQLGGCDVVVEVGPGTTLGALVRQNGVTATTVPVLATLPPALAGRDERESVLTTLAGLWESGVDVDWAATHDGDRRLVPLPGYPFQRTRYWPEPAGPAPAAETGPTASGGAHCYVPRWQRDVRVPAPHPDTGAVVVLADPYGIGSRIVEKARAAGLPAALIAGDRHGAGPEAAQQVRAELGRHAEGPGPLHVVHLGGMAPSASPRPDAKALDALHHGFDGLLGLLQALGDTVTRRPVRLLTVSAGGADVLGDDVTDPQRTVVHGLGRVAGTEYETLTWRGVDVDGLEPEPVAVALLAELALDEEPAPGGLAAWRHGHRWLRGFEPAQLPESGTPWRPDGVYLVTGGTRGLGLALATHLVATGVRRLALLSRTPRERWTADSASGVAALEAAGAEVLVLAADTGDPARLRAAITQARSHFGALHGVVHCAGVPGAGVVARKTTAGARAVLAPKVLALAPLLELVGTDTSEEERLELLVLYSSSVSVLGGLGESDYCAANTVLDAAASASAISSASRVVSVAWGPWRHDAWQGDDTGMAALSARYRDRFGFTDDDGVALLDRIIAGDARTVLALGQPLPDAVRFWATLGDVDALTAARSEADPQRPARYPRPALRTVRVPPRSPLETRVAAVWEQFLGIDGIGVDDPFFDLGGNSLVGSAMVRALGQQLSVTVPPAVLFQHPTVADLARWVDEATSTTTSTTTSADRRAGLALATGQARGARRRQARGGSPGGGISGTHDRKRGQAK